MNKKQQDFFNLYKPVHADFERFCRARVHGGMDYKDLMNETLLIAYSKFDKLDTPKVFLAYLFGISVRILANHRRKIKEFSDSYEVASMKLQDVNFSADSRVETYFLRQALAKLPDVTRESIVLFEISGFSIKEIAEIQNSSESSVKQRLRRGRIRLREILQFDATQIQKNK